MKTHAKKALVALFCGTMGMSSSLCARNPWSWTQAMEQMDAMHKFMHEQFAHLSEQMKSPDEGSEDMPTLSARTVDEPEATRIIISGIATESIDASWDEQEQLLVVKAGSDKAFVRSKKTYLELELVREMSEHEEDEEKGRKVSHNSYARAVHYCRITGKLKLEDATCSYKREQKELVVTLPKDIKAKKTIAVTVD